MKLNSFQLEAFLEVAQTRHFTEAAKKLHITQSALSQRISALETELGATLLIRDKKGPKLTEAGEKVLRYCHKNRGLEEELLSELLPQGHTLGPAPLRIAGFSSVMWSVIVPALEELVSKNAHLMIQFQAKEISELSEKLKSGEVDYIVTTEKPPQKDLEVHLLGYEENVWVQSTKATQRHSIFLDHDENDRTTFQYFRGKSKSENLTRSYMDDIQGIIAGVSHGYGSAIVPKHLIRGVKGIKNVKQTTLKVPLLLVHYRQAYYSQLHNKVLEALKTKVAPILRGERSL